MIQTPFHPAIWQLLRLQGAGRVRRIWRRFCRPRRVVLSCLAVIFAVVWVGNALLSVLYRESASSTTLRWFVSLAIFGYAAYHILRVACFRPEEPLEWTTEEREILSRSPFRPRDIIGYKLLGAATSTLIKAGCVTLLLLPDLGLFLAGFIGIALALLMVDLVRLVVEISAWGMSRGRFLLYRGSVLIGAAIVGSCVLMTVLAGSDPLPADADGSKELAWLLGAATRLKTCSVGTIGEALFRPFVEIIAAERWTVALVGWAVVALSVVAGLARWVIWLYGHVLAKVAARERNGYEQTQSSRGRIAGRPAADARMPNVLWLGGIGPMAWRQLVGARRHAGSLLTAMAVPGLMACLPLFAPVKASSAYLGMAGAVAFYSFLLLPTALKFDFRRDVDRMGLIKALPIRATALAVGQIATPVVLASLFQATVLIAAAFVRPVPPMLVGGALLVMLPLNVLIFALDNVIFLWFPYRMNQDGFVVFLRTTLSFTAKGLLFTLALVGILTWGFAAAKIAGSFTQLSGLTLPGYTVFLTGMVGALCGSGILAILLLARAYQQYDPCEDRAA